MEQQQIIDPIQRLKICKQCADFFHPTTTCKLCGCFMIAKVRLNGAQCPVRKW